jgi:hypothetical protein
MKGLALAVAVLAATFGWLAALFAAEPFARTNESLDRVFGGAPAWTQVTNLYRNSSTQEVSRGDHPLASFHTLEQSWAAHPQATRIVLLGNSQTYLTSLAPGESAAAEPEKTYPDLIADHYAAEGSRRVFYRLTAGALSYQEMLWYAAYLQTKPAIRPNVLLAQLNYQNFVNGGIRFGMLELLSDPAFRQQVEAIARQDRPYADAFSEALRQYDAYVRHDARKDDATDASADGALGYRLETGVRNQLMRLPRFQRRAAFKQDFEEMLLRGRQYVLRIQMNSRRSLGGIRVVKSRAALEDLLDLCRRSETRVILFQAPTNPASPLYRTADDDRSYHDFTNSLAARYGAALLDFEHSIPAQRWGKVLNVPDPLHLGREAHRMLAQLLWTGLGQNGI